MFKVCTHVACVCVCVCVCERERERDTDNFAISENTVKQNIEYKGEETLNDCITSN